MMNNLTQRQRIMLVAMLGTMKADEMYDVFEKCYDKLTAWESEVALELANHLLNINMDEGELLDDVIANYIKEEI